MSNIRTANRRHKRAIVLEHGRSKAAGKASAEQTKPAKAATKMPVA